MRDPNRFTEKTKDILAKRAALLCSSPYCDAQTVGPHEDDDRVLSVGEAAHIRGVNPGSARYDESMTPEERRVITNGIWLCRKCAKIIDSERNTYTVDLLYEWKRLHEDSIRREIGAKPGEDEYRKSIEKHFNNESQPAVQIALDRPNSWQHFLVIELLRNRLNKFESSLDELSRGIVLRPHKFLSELNFIDWLKEKVADLEAIVGCLMVSSTESLNASQNSDDAIEVLSLVNHISQAFNAILEWETDLKFSIFPDIVESYKDEMSGWASHFIKEIKRVPEEISKIYDNEVVEGKYHVDLVFEPPENMVKISNKITRAIQAKYS